MDSKDHDNLDCPLCHKTYNEYENIPRMLPDCGHTFCSACLNQLLQKIDKEGSFLCPEDKVPYIGNKRDIVFFPKNFALLRVLDKKRKDYFNYSEFNSKMPYFQKSENQVMTTSYPNDIKGFSNFDGRRSNSNNSNLELSDYCKEHNKKLEIICIDHKQKICVNCALFGNHKNHNIKSEEEVLREITMRADKILEIFQGIEDSSTELFQQNANEENLSLLYENFIKKTEKITKTINEKFTLLRQSMKDLEKKILNEFLEAFQLLEGKLKILKKIPFLTFKNEISSWKILAKEKLMTLSEKTEKNQMHFEILENRDNPDQDIIKVGQSLLLQTKRISSLHLNMLKTSIESIDVKFNDQIVWKTIEDTFCERGLKISPELKKNALSNEDIRMIETFFNKKNASQPITTTLPNSNFDFSMTNEEVVKSRQSIHRINERLEEKRNAFVEEKPRSNFQQDFQNANSFINSLNFQELIKESNPKLDDSEFLLSGDLSDFSSRLAQNSPNFQIGKSKPPLKHTLYEDKSSKQLQTIEERSEKAITSSKTLKEFKESGQKDQKDKGMYLITNKRAASKSPFRGSGSNTNTSLDKISESDLRNLISPNKSVSPFLAESLHDISTDKKLSTHPSQKKLGYMGFRLNEKFLPVLNGLKTDVLDVVDFTCADLGDAGLAFLADYLSTSVSMKSLKLVKNKITDEGAIILCKALMSNGSLANLNLTLNQLTEKSIDIFLGLIKANPSIKNLYLLQNNISVNKFKIRIKDFKVLGTNLFI